MERVHSEVKSASIENPATTKPTTDIAKDEANLPCIVLPSSRFSLSKSYNREDILKDIGAHLGRGLGGFKSIALYGIGGVGKSHIAHKFAYIESQKNKYDAVLWIHSDTPSAIQQSFTEAAVKLQLPGTSPQDHTENKIRVLTWLQQTSCSWLLIFDNAEDADLLTTYWPTSNHGHGIITTRNHALTFFQADIRGIEVTPFEPDDGSKLLMHLLSRDVAGDIKDGEVTSALELSEKIHGHAQAISQMAGLIHQRSWTITNILGVVAYIAPDSIPQELFEVTNALDLPIDLKFCADNLSFSEVLENLTALALIKSDKQKREFSVHRLVQAQFIDFMSTGARQQAFGNATQLLFNVFPHSGGRMGQLYAHWGRCRQYFQHVLALAAHYKESNKTTNHSAHYQLLKANQVFCRLLAYCCRYLIEQVALEELHDLSDLAIQAYATLEEGEQDLYLDGLIHNQKGFSEYLRGNFELTKKHWKFGLDLHEKISPPDHRAVAWRSYNMGIVTAATEDYERAVKWYLYAEERWAESGDETLSCVACIRGQRAQALTFLGRFDEAKECFDFSTHHLKTSQEWGWLAFTCFAEGNYFRELSQFRMAESKYREAQDAWKTGDQTRMHDFYAACLFKLGCVEMDQGDLEKAKDHFENARRIIRAQSHSRSADYNRVLNKLYQLSTLMPTETFDIEITSDGPGLFSKVFGVQTAEVDFKTRESRFDSRVNCNWR